MAERTTGPVRLACFAGSSTGLVVDADDGVSVIDVGASLAGFSAHAPVEASTLESALPAGPSGTWRTLSDRWPEVGRCVRLLADWGTDPRSGVTLHRLSSVVLSPPLVSPDVAIFAAGANFASHAVLATARSAGEGEVEVSVAEERARQLVEAKHVGTPPWGFTILPRTIVGHDAPVTPPAWVTKFDYEGEVAVVLRGGASGLAPWGVTCWNDLSIRDKYFGLGVRVDEGPMTWSLQKNFRCGNACGPWLVVDEEVDPGALEISLRVNGDVRQKGSTMDMVYSFAELLEHFSSFLDLQTGDVVVSGTPAGTAIERGIDGPYLNDGDLVEVEVEHVGVLRNRVVRAGDVEVAPPDQLARSGAK